MRSIEHARMALVGLLVVAAISVAAGSGKKPAKEQGTTVSLRRISGDEVVQILRRFPEMVPDYLASKKNDEAYLARVFQFGEVTATPLDGVFPAARFYKGLTGGKPPIPYMMAIAGGKRYSIPGGLNQLLLDNDLKVNDKNLLRIAGAFVILALGTQRVADPETGGYVEAELLAFPKIEFLSADLQVTGESHAARLTVRIGDNEESWYVPRWHDQLGWASRRIAKGLIKRYQMPEAGPLQQQGQTDDSYNAPEAKK